MYGDELRKHRINANFSQKEISDKLGLSSAQFCSNWERGLSYPPPRILKRICALYKINYRMNAGLLALELNAKQMHKLNKRYKL